MSTFDEIMDNSPGKLSNYKIPLKTSDAGTKVVTKTEEGEEPAIKSQTAIDDLFQTPLAYVEPDTPNTMRFNYTYQHSVTITPTVNVAGKRVCSSFPPPPPPPPPIPEEEFIKRYPYLNSSTFPEPLKKLLQPLACQLCHVRLNSRISGKMHYDSKNHEKKVHIWLQQWAKQTGEPAPKRLKIMKDNLPVGPTSYRCEPCDIALTSVQHAEQHYNGKKHRAVAMGLSAPFTSGYYDINRKWIRTQPEPVAPIVNFYDSAPAAVTKSPAKMKAIAATINSTDPSIFCNICNIHVSRESQMKAHLEGAKHAKILRSLQAPPYVAPHETLLTSVTVVTPLKDGPVVSQPKIDISIYRTPSGSFYCQLCDITLETEHLFNQHLNCKKHIRKQNTNGKE